MRRAAPQAGHRIASSAGPKPTSACSWTTWSLQGVTEPYRMLTARSEFRLALRADKRRVPVGSAGVAGVRRRGAGGQGRHLDHCGGRGREGEREGASPAQYAARGCHQPDGRWRSAFEGWVAAARLEACGAFSLGWRPPAAVLDELAAEAVYAPYLARQAEEPPHVAGGGAGRAAGRAGLLRRPGLSLEMRQRLEAAKPSNLGAASRVPGITPAALAALTVHLR
jgi:tRNA uridine 5-carboxymethylaminomethyl modification enzyme